MNLKRISSERNIYFLFVLVALIPVCLTRYIGSLDGPMHLHVSNIIGGLLTGDRTMHDFFQLNPLINGNISGNYLLAIFNLLLPAWLAEKLLILTYLIGFYASFRYLVKSINPKPGYLTLLIIPFAYNSLFLLGYYNFSLALGLLMLIVGFWVRHYKSTFFRVYPAMALLLLLLYYTHLVIFTFTLLIIGTFTFVIFILEWNTGKPKYFQSFLARTAGLVICALPGLILAYIYLGMIPKPGGDVAVVPFEHWHYLNISNYLIGFNHSEEDNLGTAVFVLILSLIIVIVGWRIFRYFKSHSKYTTISFYTDLWLVMAGIFLMLYLVMPNTMSLKVRFVIVFIILLIVWISSQKVPAFISMPAALIMLFLGFRLQQEHIKHYKHSDKIIQNIVGLESFLTENETIVSYNYNDNWLFYHFVNYLGVEKRIVDLQVHSVSPLFAVNWKKNKPYAYIGACNSKLLIPFDNSFKADSITIASHIFVLDYKAFKKVEKTDVNALLIRRDYDLEYVSPDELMALFRYRNPPEIDILRRILATDEVRLPIMEENAKKYGISLSTAIEHEALWRYDQSVPVIKYSE